MRTRPFYLLACALAMVAIVVEGASKPYAAKAAKAAARAAESHVPEDREALHLVACYSAAQADRLSLVAVVALVVAVGGWICSLLRRERGWQSIPLLLLLLAGLLQLILV